jgi:hypothetical protein
LRSCYGRSRRGSRLPNGSYGRPAVASPWTTIERLGDSPDDHIGTAIALAGDELTGPQIAAAFEEATGLSARFEQQRADEIRRFSEDLARYFAAFAATRR